MERSDHARGTHKLETAEGGTSQNTESKQMIPGDSLPENRKRRDKSGHSKKSTGPEALTLWRQQRGRRIRTRIRTDRGRGTHQLGPQRKKQIRT